MFYTSLAADLTADIPTCYWAGHDDDSGAYAIVLEDLGHLAPGDDVAGGDPVRAERAVGELALLHGPRWGDARLAELTWLNRYPRGQAGILHGEMSSGVDRLDADYADDLAPDVLDLVRRFALVADRYDRKGFGGPRTIVHADFRDDNLMFGPDRACILDWQTVQLGAGLADLAYYLGTSLRIEDRRAHEDDLVRSYHQRLLAQDVELEWDTCWREYRRHGFCLLTTVLKFINGRPDLPQRTRQLIVQMIRRGAHQAMDLDSLNLLTA
jgi:aminoglycoside/choline kinase family phosphotransferase